MSITVKQLREALQVLPDDAHVSAYDVGADKDINIGFIGISPTIGAVLYLAENDEDSACPVSDPDCLSNDDESHDACEAPDSSI